MFSLLLTLGLALQPQTAQEVGPAAVPDDKTSVFGEPLYVNGKRISDYEIKQWILLGPGRSMVDAKKVDLIIEEELRRRAEEFTQLRLKQVEKDKPFATPAERQKFHDEEYKRQHDGLLEEFTSSDEAIQKEFDRTIADFRRKYPLLDPTTEIYRAYRSPEWYRAQINQTLRYDRVFLPHNPEEWPIVTIEAVMADSGEALWEDAKQSYEVRKRWQEEQGGDFPPEDAIYQQMLRQIVRDALFSLITFKSSFDGLPVDVLLTADSNSDGTPEITVKVDELWPLIVPTLTEQEVRDAKTYVVALHATRDQLAKDGRLPTVEDRQKVLAKVMKGLEGTYLNLDILAMQTQYFPSTETFLEYEVLKAAYADLVADKIAPGGKGELNPILREHYEKKSVKIMGLGQVDPEVMLVSAFDIPNYRWKPDGWAQARKQAEAVITKVRANDELWAQQKKEAAEAQAQGKEYKPEKPAQDPYRYWTDLMNDNSSWWDPPAPEGGKAPHEVVMKKKGRFGMRYRNDLEMVMLENKYRHWVNGFSATDAVFFDTPEGQVSGPFKCTMGFYVARVNKRTGPSRGLNFGDPRHVELVRDDYLKYELVSYTQKAIQNATIKGF